jgi:hypothetical protein
VTRKKKKTDPRDWYLVDLHLHTPASQDFQDENVTYLDILRRSRERGLDMICFADHNTIAGSKAMREEIHQLELLEGLKRLNDDERARLDEYRRLLEKLVVLPGFEFTATFGFHILGIFREDKDLREIEHLLLSLQIPPEKLDEGSSEVGATTDVLTAYRLIDEAGGLVIAAHANSSSGVAMRRFPFGGQTKIAYTQDEHLHALEVTDLGNRGRHSTVAFFSGTKPEYPRRMHCIQGSDAHKLMGEPSDKKHLGVGDRPTEVLLPELSFDALKELFKGNDFARTRPYWPKAKETYDFVQQAREDGASIVQDFHESMTVRGGRLYAIIADVCALANTNGGTLYVGVGSDPKKPPAGISDPDQAIGRLEKEISGRISPPLTCEVDKQKTRGKTILRVLVPRGDDPPYAVDDNKIYVRDETDTGLAVRDEIVQLVTRGRRSEVEEAHTGEQEASEGGVGPPKTGVEIAEVEERNGVRYFAMRDLRNGNVVKNVTESSARRLWHYAISQYNSLPEDKSEAPIQWKGNLGLLRVQRRGNRKRYDFAQRNPDGIRLYFGVTDDGIHGAWRNLVNGKDG